MLRRLSFCAALVVAVALAAPVAAQAVNLGSTENVVPARTGLEAQRKALFAQMLRDPSDLDAAFEYAALSVQAGDLESAVSTLERMLVFAPGLPRLQFELGVLYYRLGAFEMAGTYFREVQAASDVPPEVLAEIGGYLQAIEARASGNLVSGIVAVGARYQTNANSGPNSTLISLNGLPFVLSGNALGAPDANGFAAARLNASLDLESQGDRFDIALNAYGAIYHQTRSLDTGIIELTAGPTLNLQRYSIDNATLALYGIAGGGMLGGAPFLGTLGLGANLQFVLDARSRVTLKGEARYERYFDSAMRPTASLRTGQDYLGAFTYDYQLTQAVGLFLALTADRRLAQRGFLSAWQVGAEAGATIKVPSPIASLKQPWIIGLSTGVANLRSDAPDPVFSATAVENTTRVFVQGTLTVPLPNDFAIQTSASYTRSMSNYGLSTFNNFGVSAALSKGF